MVGSRDMFKAMCQAIETHQTVPLVDKLVPFARARAAFEATAAGEYFGKIVLEF